MKTSDLIAIGILGAGAFVLFTAQGRNMLKDMTGIEVPNILDELKDAVPDEILPQKTTFGKESDELYQKDYYSTPMLDDRDLHPNYYSKDYHYPIQDLFIPPNYYDIKYEYDKYRYPSDEFWDWYRKSSGLKFEDYYYPPHYPEWPYGEHPDYYYFFGNRYRRWYPNIYDIPSTPPHTRRIPYWFGEVYY